MTPWLEFVSENLEDELRGPKKVAERHGAADFVEWADASKVPFPPTESVDEVLSRYSNTLDAYKGPRGLNKKGRVALEMARRILTMAKEAAQGAQGPQGALGAQGAARGDDVPAKPDSASAKPDSASAKPDDATGVAGADAVDDDESFTEEENEMPRTPRQEELNEELMEEEEVEGGESEEEEEEVEEELEEEPPRKRRRNASQQRIVVQLPPQRRASVGRAEPRSSSLRSILPRTEKIRIYKRDELGKRQHIEDYSADEIGNVPLETFLRNYINPNFHNESGVTEYIAYELDARTGREKMPPAVITIETPVEDSTDAFGQVRKAMGLINDLQQVAAPQQASANVDLLRRAQADAVGRGDMNSMMMLLMMERLMTGGGAAQNSTADLLLKVLDRLDKVEKRSNGGTPNGEFGPPPGFGSFMPPPAPPPYMGPPPAPPPATQPPPASPVGLSSLERVVELALAQMVKPPKALTEQVQEMMALKQLTSSSDEVQQLRQQVAALQAQLASSRTSSGIEDSLANFEKFTSIVKSVAPQVTGNDGGFLKGLLTSEMGKMIGDIVAKAAQQQAGASQAQQPQASQPQAQQQVSASPQPKPETSSNGLPTPPPAVVDAVRAFSVAQTPEVQAQRFVDVVLQMYTSGVPHYRQLLDPALEALNNSDKSVESLNVARKTALALVREIRPQIATPEFVDKCIAALVAKAGAEMPETLLKTNGKWTADYMGNVLLLEQVGAKPVEEESSPKPSNGATPGEVQSPAEVKPLPLTDVVEVPPQRIEAPEPVRA
jgi:hypothetical protein